MRRFGIGQSVRRVEDSRFLTGAGCYTDDISLPGQVWGAVVRSPYAHGEITGFDLTAARAAPGVLLVLSANELMAELPCGYLPKGAPAAPRRPVLAGARIRHVGEALAFVVAETAAQARDAAELVGLDVSMLPANADPARAFEAEALHDGHPENLAFDWRLGEEAKVEAAFAHAARVVRLDLINNRLAPTALEPRGALALPEGTGLTLITGSQGVHELKSSLTAILGLPEDGLRVVTPDVGGGFGLKISAFPEHVMVLAAAKRLNRPVKWTGDRSEAFLSDTHGRDNVSVAKLAVDADGRFLALWVSTIANLGAYVSNYGAYVPTLSGTSLLTGVYAIPALAVRVRGVFTNTSPVDAYRGAGRPEAAYLIERLVDVAAHDLGIDPVALRLLNFIPKTAMPYRNAGGRSYNVGDFSAVLDRALVRSDHAGFGLRRRQSEAKGKRRGIGIANYIEISGGTGGEDIDLAISAEGIATLLVGTQSTGQGHETAFAQMVAAELGLPMEKITIVQGDSARIPTGGGTGGSRSLPQQGGAIAKALQAVIEQGRTPAARLLQAKPDEVSFAEGRYAAGSGSVAFAQAARAAAEDGAPLGAQLTFKPSGSTFPNGCHVCELEIDPETGETEILRYTIVDDVGTVLNPLLLKGQIIGGAVQGIGQALLEHAVYDDSAQLVTGSLIDYAVPRADHVPPIDFSTIEIPCPTNPLGVKGAGEAGTIGAAPAVINAVCDALGVRHVDMPATPLRLWTVMADRKASA